MTVTTSDFAQQRAALMETMLETALVPVSSALEQLPVLVRSLARNQRKEVSLAMRGEGCMVDRRILDVLREALIHLVTNAVDHGIEPTDRRLASSKPAIGTVTVTVAQSGGNRVSITVTDDGAGIDAAALANAAVQAHHIAPDSIDELDEQQMLRLALQPGVSTRKEITPVSGRGVGLAVVAEAIGRVGGELSIDNTVGAGCAFQLALPVRLETLRGLVLRVGGVSYVCPLSGVDRVRALKDGDIATVNNRETLQIGDRVLQAVRLRHVLKTSRGTDAMARVGTTSGEESVAVIAQAAGKQFALLVEDVLAEQEVLPKSLGRQLRRVRHIAGATQLGDGTLALVLRLEDIAKHGLAASHAIGSQEHAQSDAAMPARVLVAEDSITSRLLLKHILESAGYVVETAVDGLDALSRLRHETFDLVVTDIEMPRLDGLGLTERIRAAAQTAELPVVLVTSLQSPEEKERGLQAGADAYVVKGSFDQDNLLATIRRLV
jgi:two-component system chemotaxis sensor kinase CheA